MEYIAYGTSTNINTQFLIATIYDNVDHGQYALSQPYELPSMNVLQPILTSFAIAMNFKATDKKPK